MVSVTCSCGVAAAMRGTHLPRGWKRLAAPICAACVKARYVQRSVVIPVAGPVDATWSDLRQALRESWVSVTSAANWICTQLYARDVRREPGETKLRPMPRLYLYPELRVLYPALPAITLPTLCQQVERTYRAQRYELLWTSGRSLATHRYPVPLPLHQTQWRLERTPGGAMIAHVKVGDRWWSLRLRGGGEFHRKQQQLSQLLSSSALPASGAIYRRVAKSSDHRSGPAKTRILLKLVGWFPREVLAREACGMLRVETACSDLVVCRVAGRGIVLTIHGDEVRRRITGYEISRQRRQETLGVVRRWVPAERARVLADGQMAARRHHRALETACQQIGAMIVGCARREHVAAVEYADEEDGFVRPFDWTRLRLAIQSAVEQAGYRMVYASGAVTADHRAPLAEGEHGGNA